jgi:tetratricopeptide (TPR) repeat protein
MESFFLNGKEQDALTCYNHATRVIKYHLGSLHPALLECYNALARLYYTSKKYSQALEYYTKALNLSNKILGTNHPHTASYCNKCGHTYKNLNDFEHAMSMYERALLIYNTVLGPNTLTVAHSYFSISGVLSVKGKQIVLQRSTVYARYSTTISQIETYFFLGDFERALDNAMKAQVIRERILGQRHPLTLASIYQVAYTADRLDNYQVAIPYFERLLTHLKMVKDESVIQDIQNITKAIIKLKFRNLVPTQRMLLEKIRAHNSVNQSSHSLIIETTIAKLFKHNPSEYLEELLLTATISQEAYSELACVEQLVEDKDVVIVGPEIPHSLERSFLK